MTDFRKRRLAVPLLVAVVLFAAASFTAIGVAAAGAPRRPVRAIATTTIASRRTKARVVLVGPRRQTLFLHTRDRHDTSTCYGRCAREWRPLRASGRLIAKRGSGVKQQWLSTTRRRGGVVQVSYDHHPLYVHAGNEPSSLNGDHTMEMGLARNAAPLRVLESMRAHGEQPVDEHQYLLSPPLGALVADDRSDPVRAATGPGDRARS